MNSTLSPPIFTSVVNYKLLPFSASGFLLQTHWRRFLSENGIQSAQGQWAAHTEWAEVESVSFLSAGLQLHCNSPEVQENTSNRRNKGIRKSWCGSKRLCISRAHFQGEEGWKRSGLADPTWRLASIAFGFKWKPAFIAYSQWPKLSRATL